MPPGSGSSSTSPPPSMHTTWRSVVLQDSQPTIAPPSTLNQFTAAPPQPYRPPQSVQQLAAVPIVVAVQPRCICLLLYLPSLKPTRSYWPQSTKEEKWQAQAEKLKMVGSPSTN